MKEDLSNIIFTFLMNHVDSVSFIRSGSIYVQRLHTLQLKTQAIITKNKQKLSSFKGQHVI